MPNPLARALRAYKDEHNLSYAALATHLGMNKRHAMRLTTGAYVPTRQAAIDRVLSRLDPTQSIGTSPVYGTNADDLDDTTARLVTERARLVALIVRARRRISAIDLELERHTKGR